MMVLGAALVIVAIVSGAGTGVMAGVGCWDLRTVTYRALGFLLMLVTSSVSFKLLTPDVASPIWFAAVGIVPLAIGLWLGPTVVRRRDACTPPAR